MLYRTYYFLLVSQVYGEKAKKYNEEKEKEEARKEEEKKKQAEWLASHPGTYRIFFF